MPIDQEQNISDSVGHLLPYLRRYARALTGNQDTGDKYAVATLEALLADRSIFDADEDPKVSLFRAFHKIWTSAGAPVGESDPGIAASAQKHLARLTKNSREVLLLNTIEGISVPSIARIIEEPETEVEYLLSVARSEMSESIAGEILVIEDEAIIALDLEHIVTEMGHRVTGVARTRAGAVDLAGKQRPDLILSDIQLADGSSGIDAVDDILSSAEDIPVVFITAFPERLLTGQRREPAFVITKPYTEEQVQSAISQAMFFSSTETLTA